MVDVVNALKRQYGKIIRKSMEWGTWARLNIQEMT